MVLIGICPMVASVSPLPASANAAPASATALATRPGLAPAALVALARELAAAVCREQVPVGEGRRWVRLADELDHDAWLIAWPRGSGLGLHDHGGSGAAVHVVDGELIERYVAGRSRHDVRTRIVGAGELVTFGAGHVHALHNDADDEALSVHVYSPPLGPMTFFE